MTKLRLVSTIALAGFAAFIGMTSVSEAAITAMAGLAQNPADDTCFGNGNGRITNNCAATKQYCVSTNVTSSGNKTVRVTARRPNGGTLQCHSVAVDKFGTAVSATGNVVLGVVDADTQFTVGTVAVPGFGAAYVCCDMSNSARIDTVDVSN
jgi:hypothetical protein